VVTAADAAYAAAYAANADAYAAYAAAAAHAAYAAYAAAAAHAANAAYAYAAAYADCALERARVLARCARIVRKHYPQPPIPTAERGADA
jgi:hypothetical protein